MYSGFLFWWSIVTKRIFFAPSTKSHTNISIIVRNIKVLFRKIWLKEWLNQSLHRLSFAELITGISDSITRKCTSHYFKSSFFSVLQQSKYYLRNGKLASFIQFSTKLFTCYILLFKMTKLHDSQSDCWKHKIFRNHVSQMNQIIYSILKWV